MEKNKSRVTGYSSGWQTFSVKGPISFAGQMVSVAGQMVSDAPAWFCHL